MLVKGLIVTFLFAVCTMPTLLIEVPRVWLNILERTPSSAQCCEASQSQKKNDKKVTVFSAL